MFTFLDRTWGVTLKHDKKSWFMNLYCSWNIFLVKSTFNFLHQQQKLQTKLRQEYSIPCLHVCWHCSQLSNLTHIFIVSHDYCQFWFRPKQRVLYLIKAHHPNEQESVVLVPKVTCTQAIKNAITISVAMVWCHPYWHCFIITFFLTVVLYTLHCKHQMYSLTPK